MAKKFKGTLQDGFLDFVETNGRESFGYVNVTSKAKQNAKVYVRYGTIVAIDNLNYRTNILERVSSIDGVNERSLEILSNRFKDDEGNIGIVEAALDQQLASSADLSKIIKENFIDSFYDMWGWEQIVLEWVNAKEPSVPTVPAIQPTDLVNKAELIGNKIVNEIAPMLQVEPEEILKLTPNIGSNSDYSNLRPNEMVVLQYSTGEYTLEDIIYGTGSSLSGTQFAVARLWLSQHLNLVTKDGEIISFREEEEEVVEEAEEELQNYEHEEAEEEAEDDSEFRELANEIENLYEEEAPTSHPVDEAALPAEEEEIVEEEILEEPVFEEAPRPPRLERRPRKLTFEEALALGNEEEAEETSTEEPEEEESEETALEEAEGLIEEIEAVESLPPTTSNNTRLSHIVEQLKTLMLEAQESVRCAETNLESKKNEMDELYAQKRELNSRIAHAEDEYAALLENKQQLVAEYREIIQQVKGMEGTL